MKVSRFTEEQIIGVLREQEVGGRRPTYAASTGTAARHSTNGNQVRLTRRPRPRCGHQESYYNYNKVTHRVVSPEVV